MSEPPPTRRTRRRHVHPALRSKIPTESDSSAYRVRPSQVRTGRGSGGWHLPFPTEIENPTLNPLDIVECYWGSRSHALRSFSEIDFGRPLTDNLLRYGFVKPTHIQSRTIPLAMAGWDLMVCVQSGSGTTAAFCLPFIGRIWKQQMSGVNSGQLRIYEMVKKFSYGTGIKVVVANQLCDLRRDVDILVATPGHLVGMIDREKISLKMIKYLALDEAALMLGMGCERQIRKIVEQTGMPPPGARQTLLFSATFPTNLQRLASDFLCEHILVTVGMIDFSTDLIVQKVELVHDMDKRYRLIDIIRDRRTNDECGLTVVFVKTTREAYSLGHWLCENSFQATVIHDDKLHCIALALRSIKTGKTPILVAWKKR